MMVVNLSAYKFVPLEKIKTLQVLLKAKCETLHLLGTIIIGHEGINMNVAGARMDVDQFKAYLIDMPTFSEMSFKESHSEEVPFEKLVVRLKEEIVTIRDERADPLTQTGQYVDPKTLKQWLDEGRSIKVLDTRNDFEVAFGTFEQAEHLSLSNFSEFPEKLSTLPDAYKEETIVTFCTGGIRCEKAVLVMQQEGFKRVYQLAGGLLKYFEECQGAHYQGDCFVFDERISVDPNLAETGTTQCPTCFGPIQQSETTCQHCTD